MRSRGRKTNPRTRSTAIRAARKRKNGIAGLFSVSEAKNAKIGITMKSSRMGRLKRRSYHAIAQKSSFSEGER